MSDVPKNHSPAKLDQPEVNPDALIEDLFGLNLKGLKTLRDLFVRPRVLFESARVPDWNEAYTPTVRLAFSLITLFTVLSFFWAAEDGPFYQTLLAQTQEANADNPNAPPAGEIVSSYFAAYSFVYPFAYMVVHGVLASLLFVWGKGTYWVVRVRLYFALLSTALVFGVASIAIMPLLQWESLLVYTFFTLGFTFAVYWWTYARGMSGEAALGKRVIGGGSTALMMIIGDLGVAVITSLASAFWTDRLIG